MTLNRRHILAASLTLGAMNLFPGLSWAQARKLVFATFTGSWEEAHREVIVPHFRKANGNADIALDPMLSVDMIAKVAAAKNNPPIDVMLMDPGPRLTLIDQGLTAPFPTDGSKNYKDLLPVAQLPEGPGIFFQAVGITYNPEKVKTPPTSWDDLWKPEYKGRVGITNMNSTLGTAFMVELAKTRGGGEDNIDPAFAALKELQPNLGAVAPNPGALATLFQQGQIDISPGNFNAIQILRARGVPVEFAKPKTGTIAFLTTAHIAKNTPNGPLAAALIDSAMAPEVQTKLMQAPFFVIPTNSKVKMEGDIARMIAKDQEELKASFVFHDWSIINKNRAAWIERFNKEIKV
ncbi:ABC transporter substrate-binding protein [Azospirillum rugosum]|uniref:Spermidine/putrescine transport system substrate-binding protein n=1 Tax=Azospirillum rugosum TaxID=416170 RepID=A0ABS4SUF4_9PROT|nr:ABC transporter substrate-binding protein [Azospirillum rugosum]MBP2296192.1 putative spermidine/putrescine transport system substrate-binding protein [Azospirillum rugosum]MDQ0527123.1 putative spermidine/putrescine transport system substrate-binding protein [Azospirillum rugosum]